MKNKTTKPKTTKVLGLGFLDFSFCLDITEDDEIRLGIDFRDMTAEDVGEVILGDQSLIERVNLNTNSSLINTLLYINKTNKKKTFIEYTSYNSFNLNEDQKQFRELITKITELKYIFINELNISPTKSNTSLTIYKDGSILKELAFGIKEDPQDQDPKEEEDQEKEKAEKPQEEENKDKKEGAEGKDSNEIKKEDLKSSPDEHEEKKDYSDFPEKLKVNFNDYDYVAIDLNEIIKSSITLDEVNVLLQYLQSFYPSIKSIVIYPNIVANLSSISLDNVEMITNLLALTDIFIFEKKDAVTLFNLIKTLNDPNFKQEKGKISPRQLQDLFTSAFKSKKTKATRTGIFLDDFNKVIIVESNGKCSDANSTSMNYEYELNLHPKVNHTNRRLIDEYKKHLALNGQFLKSVFFGGFLSRFLNFNGHVPSVLAGSEIVKRILELYKLELEFPNDPQFYNVVIKKSKANDGNLKERQKESNFVLDCINVNSSKLGSYDPLSDNNLYSFFSSMTIRKHLKEVGFINTNGFILGDPERRNLGSSKDKALDDQGEKERKLLIAVQENEAKKKQSMRKNLINKSKQLHDPSIMELEKLVQTREFTKDKHKQLPSFEYGKSQRLRPIRGYYTADSKLGNDKGNSSGFNKSNEKV